MAQIRIERVLALPTTLSPSTMYVVRSPDPTHAGIYFTSADGLEIRHVVDKAEVEAMISAEIASFSNITVVPNIAARDAQILFRNSIVLVLDAIADLTTTGGAAMYVYQAATGLYTKVSDFDSLDLTLTWGALQNKPASTVAAIDASVAASHNHANSLVLAKLNEVAGKLVYNGVPIPTHLEADEW